MTAHGYRYFTTEGMAFGHELAQALRKMHSATSDALQDDGFLFQLYLPDGDDVSVFDRADALAGWVNHFLLGLGVTQPKLDKVTGETGEVIKDVKYPSRAAASACPLR